MKYIWFKAKKYGLGWYPATWQGWVVMMVYLFATVGIFRYIDLHSHSGSDTLIGFFLPFIGLTFILVFVAYLTGEPLGWRWGDKDK